MSFTSVAPDMSRWRDVYVAATARGISICGDVLAATALLLALQAAGAGGLAVSGLVLGSSLPLVLLAPLAGRIADRIDSRALLVVTGTGQALVCAMLAFTDDPVEAIVLVVLLTSGLAVTQPTVSALLPAMVRRDDLARAGAVNQTAGSLGMLLGPALAGLLVGGFGTRLPLLLDAASYLAIVAAGLVLKTRRGRGVTPAGPALPAGGEDPSAAPGWTIWRDPLLRALTLSMAAVIGGVGAINVVEVFFIRETLGSSEVMYGLVGAVFVAGMLAGAPLLAGPARRARDDGGLVLGAVLMLGALCATLPAAAVVSSAGWLVPLWLAGGVLNAGMNVFAGAAVARRVPADRRGRAFATLGGAVQGAAMLGYLAGGLLVDRIPTRLLVAGIGLFGVAAVAALAPVAARAARVERSGSRASADPVPAAAAAAAVCGAPV